jgi:hypothetical protein
MKTGRSLVEIAAELQRQAESRKDYLAPQGKIEAVVGGPHSVVLAGLNGAPVTIQPFAHGQLAQHLGIPKGYYDRMLAEQPALLAKSINTWFAADPDNERMIRTLDNQARAILSPKFRALDNFDLAQAVFPVLVERKVEIKSVELTETRFYIKGILPELSDEIPAGMEYGVGHNRIGGDRGAVVASVVIANSDVGNGSLRIEPGVFTATCTNLMILKQAAMKKYHVGRAAEAEEGSYEVFQSDTRRAVDQAFWLKTRDIVTAAFDETRFRAAVAQLRQAAQAPITSGNFAAVVEKTVQVLSLPVSAGTGILEFLAKGGDFTKWGLSSAITRVANDVDDYELATQLERAGGEVIELPRSDWEAVATAA